MPINNAHFPILSFDQSNSILTGFQRSQEIQKQLQEILRQKLANQAMQNTVQYTGPQAAAELLKSQLGNQQMQSTMPYAGPSAAAQLQTQQLENIKKQTGLDLLRNYLGGGQQSQPSQNVAPVQSLNVPSGLTLNEQQQAALAKRFPQNFSEQASHPITPAQQNQQKLEQAQKFAIAAEAAGLGNAPTQIANQIREGTPQQRFQYASDINEIKQAKESEASALAIQSYLKDYRERLQKLSKALFLPGFDKAAAILSPDYQILQRDAERIGNYLPNIYGIPPKGFNIPLEQSLRRIAGNPFGQRKETLESDLNAIQELADKAEIDSFLKQYHREQYGDLSKYHPYAGGAPTQFKSKSEYHQWLESIPPYIQEAVHRQIRKTKEQT